MYATVLVGGYSKYSSTRIFEGRVSSCFFRQIVSMLRGSTDMLSEKIDVRRCNDTIMIVSQRW